MQTANQFRQTLEDEIVNEITIRADDIARDVVTAVWNAVDNQIGAFRDEAHDADQARGHYKRSAEHIGAKRDLAEQVLAEWESGRLPADDALRMIRAALAVGDVKTLEQLRAANPQPTAEGFCTFGVTDAPGSGCVLLAGHEPANRHIVTPGDDD
jgi:hypothetical protein